MFSASSHHFRPSAPETSWLLFIQHPNTVNKTLHIYPSALNVRQWDQNLVCSYTIQIGVESGVHDNPLTISLRSSVILSSNDTERKEEGRSARETKQRKYLGIRQCVPGCVFSQERPGGHSVSGERPTCTNYSTQTRLLGETDLALPPLTTYQPESWRGERSLVITS